MTQQTVLQPKKPYASTIFQVEITTAILMHQVHSVSHSDNCFCCQQFISMVDLWQVLFK